MVLVQAPAALTHDPLTRAANCNVFAQTRTKGAFDALLASKAAPGNEAVIVKAYGNAFPEMPLGGVDALSASPESLVPSGGASAGVAAWRAAFESMGLRPADLALLGPDVICADEAAAVEMMRSDEALRKALDDLEAGKKLLTRTTYEVPYGRAFDKARARMCV